MAWRDVGAGKLPAICIDELLPREKEGWVSVSGTDCGVGGVSQPRELVVTLGKQDRHKQRNLDVGFSCQP